MLTKIKNHKIGILGLGTSGIAAANFAHSKGAFVLASESKPEKKLSKLHKSIKAEFGRHSNKLFEMDLVVKSPGIHQNASIIKQLRKRKIPVLSEIDFALMSVKPQRVIAITGTNGKTTTTTLVGSIFRESGRKTFVTGNIGMPLAQIAPKIDNRSNVVIEMSSYQLEDSSSFHPNISAILNITEDHIEHHHTMENYIKAKAKIYALQNKNDFCILNYDDKKVKTLSKITVALVFLERVFTFLSS